MSGEKVLREAVDDHRRALSALQMRYGQLAAEYANAKARWEALRRAAQEIRDRAARYQCSDALCCGDPSCIAAGHHDEHETTSDGEGWCCGHDECQCIPACSGMAPHVCQELEWMQTTVETLDAALAALDRSTP